MEYKCARRAQTKLLLLGKPCPAKRVRCTSHLTPALLCYTSASDSGMPPFNVKAHVGPGLCQLFGFCKKPTEAKGLCSRISVWGYRLALINQHSKEQTQNKPNDSKAYTYIYIRRNDTQSKEAYKHRNDSTSISFGRVK